MHFYKVGSDIFLLIEKSLKKIRKGTRISLRSNQIFSPRSLKYLRQFLKIVDKIRMNHMCWQIAKSSKKYEQLNESFCLWRF